MQEFFSHIPLFGTALNSGAILIGGTAGTVISGGAVRDDSGNI